MRAFNPGVLYLCLFGNTFGIGMTTNSNPYTTKGSEHKVNKTTKIGEERIRDFISLYTKGDRDKIGQQDVPYFRGIVNSSGHGTVPQEVNEFLLNDNNCMATNSVLVQVDRFKNFFLTYQNDLTDRYREYVRFAMKCDDRTKKFAEDVYSIEDKEAWFMEAVFKSLTDLKGYFDFGDNSKKVFEDIYKIIKKTVDDNKTADECRGALSEYWNKIAPMETDDTESVSSVASGPRKIAKAWFTAKKGTGRYNGYFETRHGNPIHNLRNKLAVDEKGEYALFDILFPNETENKDSVNLCGRGGSGKTYQIFHCIEDIFRGKTTNDKLEEVDISGVVKNVIPIYIPLNSLEEGNGNCIISFLAKEVWQMKSAPENIVKVLHDNAENVLIFADGLNEITDPNMRKKIAGDICNLRQLHRTRFLVSSRIDHTNIFNSLNYGSDQIFTKASVLDLTPLQIDTYFEDVRCDARYMDVPVNTRKLLKTPQGCVMFADYVGSHSSLIKKIESLGQLISDYSRRLLDIKIGIQTEEIENILKKIAHHMLLSDSFKISWTEIKNLLDADEMKLLLENRSNIESVFSSYNGDSHDYFEFSHQNFRDNYCALSYSDRLKSIRTADGLFAVLSDGTTFVNNNITTNDEVLELVSASIDGETIQEIIDMIRSNATGVGDVYGDGYYFPLSILIRIFAFSHGNCLADLDLSDLDLTKVSLNGYELFDREGCGSINLSGATINANTFLKTALQTASSTICKYELKNKTYITAFATTTAVIIDIEKNQLEVIRDMPDYGWVNCAVPRKYNGQMCIFLGCRNGNVALFHPEKERNFRKEIFITTKNPDRSGETVGEIETIVFPVWGEQEYIVFCNSNGEVFYRELYPTDGLECKKISLCENREELNSVRDRFTAKDWDMTCRLSLRRDSIIAGFGDTLFNLKFDKKSKKLSKSAIPIRREREKPYLILDVHTTDNYIFVNEGDLVSIIAHSRMLGIKQKEICVFEISDTLPGSIARHHFNDKSQNNIDFYFNSFSEVPCGIYTGKDAVEAVLVGIKAYHSASYDQLPQFFEIGMKIGGRNIDSLTITEMRNEQKLATHTGVYYLLNSTVHLATTCDDRSIDLQTPHNEEIATVHKSGAYNGVHSISILDSTHIICALYDGNAVLITCDKISKDDDFDDDDFDDDFSEDFTFQEKPCVWSVKNVRKIHRNWVWKICAYDYENWSDKNSSIVTCSYDKTVALSDFRSHASPQEIVHGNKPILDFYIPSSDNRSIWAISESHIYYSHLRNGEWEYDSNPISAIDGTYFRAIVENTGSDTENNTPLVFYNSGNGSDGWLGKVVQGYVTPFKNLGRNVFIRQMKNHSVDGVNHLFAVGELDKKAYVAIYKVLSHDDYEPVSSMSIEGATGANSFSYVALNDSRLMFVMSKNNLVSVLKLDENLQISPDIETVSVPAQPMCIDSYIDENGESLILVGLLNGQIMRLQADGLTKISASEFITTHADLIADPDINLSSCKFEDDSAKKSFIRQLKDYFTI